MPELYKIKINQMKKNFLILIFIILYIFGHSVFSNPVNTESSPIRMNADKLIYDDKTMLARLEGNVKITYEDAVMTSKNALFKGKERTGYFTGNVKIVKEGSILTGDKMSVFYNEKRALLSGNVRAVTNKIAEKDSKGEPTILECKNAEFFWNENEIFAKENLKVTKGNKRAFADLGHYSQKTQTVVLTGNVRFEQGKNNWMTAPEAIFDMKEEIFLAKGGVTAEIEINKEKKQTQPINNDRILMPKISPIQEDIMIRSEHEEES